MGQGRSGARRLALVTLVTLAAALSGCSSILGIEVLGYDGSDEGGTAPGDAAGDSTTGEGGAGRDAGHDGSLADGDAASGLDVEPGGEGAVAETGASDGPVDGPQETSSSSSDGGDAATAADTGGSTQDASDGSTTPEAGCASTDTGCHGNTPWTCVGGQPTDQAACVDKTCASGACVGVCAPGQTQCTAGNASFQSCQSDGTWGSTVTCTAPTNGAPTCDPKSGCGAGACSIAPDTTLCNAQCVDVTSDGFNCGACSQTCTGSTCSGGFCATQKMCDGSSLGVTNTGNAARLAMAMGTGVGQQNTYHGYFGVSGSVYDCLVSGAVPSPAPVPTVALASNIGTCSHSYGDAVYDSSAAYSFVTAGADCHGTTLASVPKGTLLGSPSAGTLLADVAGTGAVYTMASPVLDVIDLSTGADGGPTTTSPTCVSVPNTLVDGAVGGGHVVAVDSSGVIVGATASGGTCSGGGQLASGMTAEHAIAVAPKAAIFAFENGASVYACPTTGCASADLTTPLAGAQGTVGPFGMVFDGASPPSLYWVGTQGLVKCSSVAPGVACTPHVLVPSLPATSGIMVDSTYVYYLNGMVVSRVSK